MTEEELTKQPPVPTITTTDDNDNSTELAAAHDEDSVDPKQPISEPTEGGEANAASGSGEAPPPKPPRPESPFTRAQNQLQEAFPSIDQNVIRAMLVASGGRLNPAFNGLLSMSDPDFKLEDLADARYNHGAGASGSSSAAAVVGTEETRGRPGPNQVEQDEALARQLASQEEERSQTRAQAQVSDSLPPPPRPPYKASHSYSPGLVKSGSYSGRYDDPRQHQQQQHPHHHKNFVDDELPELRENLQKGFYDTRQRFNSWVTNLRKVLDAEEEPATLFGALGSPPSSRSRSRHNSSDFGIPKNKNSSARVRKHSKQYDRDPDQLSSDLKGVSLKDNDPKSPPPKPARPGQQRTVSALGETTTASELAGGNSKKWEPLNTSTTAATSDKKEDEKDPFFIGESDDEDDQGTAAAKKTET